VLWLIYLPCFVPKGTHASLPFIRTVEFWNLKYFDAGFEE